MKKRDSTTGIIPAITCKDSDIYKIQILNDNRNKGGIYCWINNINKKIYVGSSINLTNRFYKYYSVKHLTLRKTPIHNALLKYGYSNFTLLILEYITEKEQIIKREQYYLDFLKPQYNILEKANSFLGYKHTEETLKFFREQRILDKEARNKLSIAATGRILPQEIRDKISTKRKGIKLSEETHAKIAKSAISLRGIKVDVINTDTKEKLDFDNLTAAAKYIGVTRPAVAKALKNWRRNKKYLHN